MTPTRPTSDGAAKARGRRTPAVRRVSGRGLARELGVSEAAVRRAVKDGRISAPNRRGFDVERARNEWKTNTDLMQSRGGFESRETADAKRRLLSARATLAEIEAAAATRRADSLPRAAVHRAVELAVLGAVSEAFDAAVAHLGELFPESDPARLVSLGRRVQESIRDRMLPWARQHVDGLLALQAGNDPLTGAPLGSGTTDAKGAAG